MPGLPITELNHVALQVADTGRSVAFYRDVVGLAPLARPAFGFPGAWFRIGVNQELHLIEGRDERAFSTSRANHFAMMVSDIAAAVAHLRAHGVTFRGPHQRPDGATQIFFEDPDGHVVELCTAPKRGHQ